MAVEIKRCQLFNETLAFHLQNTPGIARSYAEFIRTKEADPMQKYGPSDYPMTGPFKGHRHAHLSQDVSIVYTISGANPHILKLYMVGSHVELGTSRTPNPKKQMQVAKQINRQQFESRRKS